MSIATRNKRRKHSRLNWWLFVSSILRIIMRQHMAHAASSLYRFTVMTWGALLSNRNGRWRVSFPKNRSFTYVLWVALVDWVLSVVRLYYSPPNIPICHKRQHAAFRLQSIKVDWFFVVRFVFRLLTPRRLLIWSCDVTLESLMQLTRTYCVLNNEAPLVYSREIAYWWR